MDLSTAPLGLVGAFAGLLLWSTSIKIFFGVLAAARNVSLPELLGELTGQKIRKFLAILFIASCLWASAFVLLALHFAAPNTAGIGWAWFFGGMAITPLFIWATTLRATRKIKKINAQSSPP